MTAPLDRLLELRVGQTECLSRTITAEDVAAFARLSGDYNALHLDDEFAARTEFAQRVVHGFLSASLLSTLVGMKVPGRGALYLSQRFEFTKPVYIGETVEARATIEKIDAETRVVTLRTEIHKAPGQCVLRGSAQVKVLRLTDRDERAAANVGSDGRLLSGRVALVTGGSRGIGRAIARLFAAHGAKVWINYNKSRGAAEELEQDLVSSGGWCRCVRADVTKKDEADRLIAEVTAGGDLDILVNNAGPKIKSGSFEDFSFEDIAGAFEDLVGSAFHVTKAALPALRVTRGGVITVLSSAALGRTAHGWLPYVMGKSALLAMCKNLAQEIGPHGVRVNVISPSMVETDLVSNVPDRIRQMIVSRTPLRRLATVEDVAGAALLLASPYAGFITGENLLVTGGETMI
ncbi:SDR family oxidoreductase [Hyphomicrobium sp. 1Nfss2.1]|uniref:SDR family oxidoreductase n=1 Tax=Hyphomicrobium sp. 1Nfss2.1 TaxID=3413936 RepID=UPI003C7BAF92